jgi:hypothetical protein
MQRAAACSRSGEKPWVLRFSSVLRWQEENMRSVAGSFLFLFFIGVLFLGAESAQGAEYVFPQVADGTSPSLAYITTFLFNNVSNTSNTVTITFYRGGRPEDATNGQLWILDLRSNDRSDIGGRNYTFTFNLAGLETVNIFTGGTGAMANGWAKIQTTAPLSVSEIFSEFRPDLVPQKINWEAGVLAGHAAARFSFEANLSADDTLAGTSVNTGYAIVNYNSETVIITPTLYTRTGAVLGEATPITLPPNGQVAEFISQRFSNIQQFPQPFHGTIRFSSDLNVVICALRWSAGAGSNVFSTVAVNPDFALGYHTYNDRESSTSQSNAQQILLPAEITGAKNVGDNSADGDWYAVSLQAGQTLFVTLVADVMGSPYDGDIRILDAAGFQLKREDNWATGIKDATLDYRATSTATYYINLVSRTGSNTSGTSYKLYVMARNVPG